MTHASGPWTINKVRGGKSSSHTVTKDGTVWTITDYKSANAYTLEIIDADGLLVTFITNNEEPMHRPVQDANARLITSAPELLETCKYVLHLLNNMTSKEFSEGEDFQARDMLSSAITLATEKKQHE